MKKLSILIIALLLAFGIVQTSLAQSKRKSQKSAATKSHAKKSSKARAHKKNNKDGKALRKRKTASIKKLNEMGAYALCYVKKDEPSLP
jgi:uncharacterized protein HemX